MNANHVSCMGDSIWKNSNIVLFDSLFSFFTGPELGGRRRRYLSACICNIEPREVVQYEVIRIL